MPYQYRTQADEYRTQAVADEAKRERNQRGRQPCDEEYRAAVAALRAPLGTLAPRARVEATKTVGTLSTQLWSCARPGSGFARCGRLSFAFLTLTFRVRNHGPKCESDLCVLRGVRAVRVGFTTRRRPAATCELRRGSEGCLMRIAAVSYTHLTLPTKRIV